MAGLNAATLALVALLPGALFVWAFERQAGSFAIGLKDRTLRLLGASAILLAITSGLLYWAYITYWETFANRQLPPWWVWSLPIFYTIGPGLIGGLLGYGWKQDWPGVRFLIGRDRAPSAWDYLFQDRPVGGIRCKLKSGAWIAGIYAETDGDQPYASGYPEPQDLYLPRTIHINHNTGQIIIDEHDNVVVFNVGVLLRWEEIEYLEFVKTENTNGK